MSEAIAIKQKFPSNHWKSLPSWGMQLPLTAWQQPQRCCRLLPLRWRVAALTAMFPLPPAFLLILSSPEHPASSLISAYSYICSSMQWDILYGHVVEGPLESMHHFEVLNKLHWGGFITLKKTLMISSHCCCLGEPLVFRTTDSNFFKKTLTLNRCSTHDVQTVHNHWLRIQ